MVCRSDTAAAPDHRDRGRRNPRFAPGGESALSLTDVPRLAPQPPVADAGKTRAAGLLLRRDDQGRLPVGAGRSAGAFGVARCRARGCGARRGRRGLVGARRSVEGGRDETGRGLLFDRGGVARSRRRLPRRAQASDRLRRLRSGRRRVVRADRDADADQVLRWAGAELRGADPDRFGCREDRRAAQCRAARWRLRRRAARAQRRCAVVRHAAARPVSPGALSHAFYPLALLYDGPDPLRLSPSRAHFATRAICLGRSARSTMSSRSCS